MLARRRVRAQVLPRDLVQHGNDPIVDLSQGVIVLVDGIDIILELLSCRGGRLLSREAICPIGIWAVKAKLKNSPEPEVGDPNL